MEHPIQREGGVEILQVASCYRNHDNLQPHGPLVSCADFTLPYSTVESTCKLGEIYMYSLLRTDAVTWHYT